MRPGIRGQQKDSEGQVESMGPDLGWCILMSPGRNSHARWVLSCSLPRYFQKAVLDPPGVRVMIFDTGNLRVDRAALWRRDSKGFHFPGWGVSSHPAQPLWPEPEETALFPTL